MANSDKFESYWTIRRRVRSNVIGHVADLTQNATGFPLSNDSFSSISEHAETPSENDVTPSEIASQNVETENEMSGSDDQEHVEIFVDHDSNSEQIDIETFFHQHNIVSDSESDSDDDFDGVTDLLGEKLKDWAVKFQISNMSLSELLNILRPICPSLPKDPRTLLKTKVRYDIEDICGGQYYHFGIVNGGREIIEKCIDFVPEGFCLDLQLNIDGLPLFKSTNHQFWPITGRFRNIPDNKPFVIGLFSGESKPNDLSRFLRNFIDEYKEVELYGFEISGKRLSMRVDSVICDAPARAFVKCTKSYSGYHGCDKCVQNGVWMGKMTFPENNSELRTDVAFDEMLDEDHHKGHSPLTELNLGMVSQFPIDYMHLVCLGVMKRLILLWMKGPFHCRLGTRSITQISECLESLKGYIPREFARKPRSLKEIERWKATEFRQFLLYTGPVALLQVLDPVLYKNFMLLCVAMHILLNEYLSQKYNTYAHDLMVAFVTHFYQVYGNDMAVYNVHGLTHLSEDAAKYGSLDSISSFPFENFLGKLKRMVRKPSFPLSQIIRRLSEQTNLRSAVVEYPIFKNEHHRGPLPDCLVTGLQFISVQTENHFFKLNRKDSCVRVEGKIGLIRNIISFEAEIFIVYQTFRKMNNFFDTPMPSHYLGIFCVTDLEEHTKVSKLSAIQAKCVLLPYKAKFIAIPYSDVVW